MKTKPKVLPYVYLDIDAEADGKEFKNREVHIGANCSVFDSTWPTKCPFYRGYMDPPQDGEECGYGAVCRAQQGTAQKKKQLEEGSIDMEKLEEFVNLVQAMRSAQKAYFRTRSHDDLDRAKKLESQVDREIQRITHPDNQEELPL